MASPTVDHPTAPANDDSKVRFVSDGSGKATAVIVPIEMWRDLSSWAETGYLLGSSAMRERLLAAIQQNAEPISLEDAKARLELDDADEQCE